MCYYSDFKDMKVDNKKESYSPIFDLDGDEIEFISDNDGNEPLPKPKWKVVKDKSIFFNDKIKEDIGNTINRYIKQNS